MAERFEYAVEGVGDFPLDMLRHDRAYPADEVISACSAACIALLPGLVHPARLSGVRVGRSLHVLAAVDGDIGSRNERRFV